MTAINLISPRKVTFPQWPYQPDIPENPERAIRHDERKKIAQQGCIHTRKAGENADYDRPDVSQWQTDQSEWFDPTICEIVSEYAAWRDAQPSAAGDSEAGRLRVALEEVKRTLEAEQPAIVCTVWCETSPAETLLDHVCAALAGSEGGR